MKLYPLLLAALLAASLSLTGCRANNAGQDTPSDAGVPSAAESAPLPEEESAPEQEEENWLESQLEGLTLDEYAGLEITAEPGAADSIAPGEAVPVTITIKNTGDNAVIYTQGSSSYQTPQALFVDVDGLQAVIPRDQLGAATMDFVTREIAPGEEERFTAYILGTEPHDAFDNYTHDLFGEDERYIAELDRDELLERYPDLTGAGAGTYTGTVYFRYTVYDIGGDDDIDTQPEAVDQAEELAEELAEDIGDELLPPTLGEPTGYSRADFTITIAQ